MRCLADAAAIADAAMRIRRGDLVAFPTETVYGLGADAAQPEAVAKLFAAKDRPAFDPLIVHVSGPDAARALWTACPPAAGRLMRAFWPGPLTIVLPKTSRVPDLVTAGLPTVAVRMPDHPIAQALLAACGCPLAAPSANRFGRSSATTAEAVEEELGDRVPLILDAGPARVGIESTVVACEPSGVILLRPGGVPIEALTEVAGPITEGSTRPGPAASPGLLARHYAPDTPLYLLGPAEETPPDAPAVTHPTARLGLLALTPITPPVAVEVSVWLSAHGDLVEAAARFFQALRRLDGLGLDAILVAPMPAKGLGRALQDRLARAASGTAAPAPGGLRFVGRGGT